MVFYLFVSFLYRIPWREEISTSSTCRVSYPQMTNVEEPGRNACWKAERIFKHHFRKWIYTIVQIQVL